MYKNKIRIAIRRDRYIAETDRDKYDECEL